jgi:hypothetical protein
MTDVRRRGRLREDARVAERESRDDNQSCEPEIPLHGSSVGAALRHREQCAEPKFYCVN